MLVAQNRGSGERGHPVAAAAAPRESRRERGVAEKVACSMAEQTGVSTRSCVSSQSVKDIKLWIPCVSHSLLLQQQRSHM